MSLEVCTTIKYNFVRHLEAGGQADRIEVVERTDGQQFVRKTYRARSIATTDSAAQKHLSQECRILSSLQHPNIVTLVDYEYRQQERWEACLYMEYCKYGNLSQYSRERSQDSAQLLSERQFWDIAFQIGAALLYCHTGLSLTVDTISRPRSWEGPILHRDIKPENVLVSSKTNDQLEVKLCDFGLAKHERSANSASFVGSIGYLPPEIVYESAAWSTKADIYSFGATMRKVTGNLDSVAQVRAFLDTCTMKEASQRLSAIGLVNMVLDNKSRLDNVTNTSISRIAVQKGSRESLKFLVKNNVDIIEEDEEGRTLLHEAAYRGWKLGIICFRELGVDLGRRTRSGASPMYLAVLNGQIAVIQYLRRHGQDVTVKLDDGATLMHAAADGGQVALIDYLHRLGLDAGPSTDNGATPMYYAALRGHIAVVDRLRQLGQSIEVRRYDGATPMHSAAYNGHIAMLDHLRQLGLDVGVKATNESTPMHYAAHNGQAAMIDHLQKFGQDLGTRTYNGETPMHWAAESGHVALVDHLRSLGQDIGVQSNTGERPIDFAAENGHDEMVNHLRRLQEETGI